MLYFGVDKNSLGTGTEEILQVQVEVKETNIWPISHWYKLKMMYFT